MCSIQPGGAATDDVVRALTGAVRALRPSGRGLVAVAEAEALLALVDAANAALLERIAVLDVDGVCQDDASLTAAAWLRRRAKSSPEAARRTVTLARRLHTDPERAMTLAGAALSAGDLTLAQVQAVADVTAVAPAEWAPPLEEALVARAAHLGAAELRRVGKAFVDRLTAAQTDDPDRVERERGGCYLRTHDTIFGRVAIEGILSPEVGSLLRAVLDPMAAPVASDGVDGARLRDPRTTGERLHDAFGELLTIAAASEATPGQGGSAPHVQVLIDVDTLLAAAARADDAIPAPGPAACTLDGLPLRWSHLGGIGCDARVSWLAVRDGASPADLPDVAASIRRRCVVPCAASARPSAGCRSRSSPPGARPGWSPRHSAARSMLATVGASFPAATHHHGAARLTTFATGSMEGQRICRTWPSSAPPTIGSCTNATGRCGVRPTAAPGSSNLHPTSASPHDGDRSGRGLRHRASTARARAWGLPR